MFKPILVPVFLFSASLGLSAPKAELQKKVETAAPAMFEIDTAHSRVTFEVAHLGFSSVSGKFTDFTGEFGFDGVDVKSITLKSSAKVESINTDQAKRDEHLKSPDFFDAKQFPMIEFVSKTIEKKDDKTFKLSGAFTMKGVTKDVTFDCVYSGKSNFMGTERVGFKGTTTINRHDFKVNFNKMAESVKVVGDEVTITVVVEATKKK